MSISRCFLFVGVGMSLAYISVLTAAISNTHKEQTGLSSGLVNTSYQIGSALGLAIIVAITSNQTETLESIGLPSVEALNGGFHSAFLVGAIISVIATAIAVFGYIYRPNISTTTDVSLSYSVWIWQACYRCGSEKYI
jgi:MFS family permease